MKEILNKISNIGIPTNATDSSIKKLQITNQVVFSLTLVAFCYAFVFYFLGLKKEGLGVSIVVVSMSLSLLFNHYRLYIFSRLWFIFVINVAVIVYTALFGKAAGIQLVYFSFVAIPWALFEFQDWKYILVGILLPCISYYVCVYNFSEAISDISSVTQGNIYFAIVIAVFVILAISIFFFVAQYHKAEQSLLTVNKELVTSRNDLRIRNEKLLEIAWIQSHKLRRPLATILGLIPLINTSNPAADENKQTLNNIKKAGEELDNVIAEVDAKTRLSDD